MNESNYSLPKNQILKKVHVIGNTTIITIDKSIVDKLNISEENNTYLLQEITEDGNGILMKVRRLEDFLND